MSHIRNLFYRQTGPIPAPSIPRRDSAVAVTEEPSPDASLGQFFAHKNHRPAEEVTTSVLPEFAVEQAQISPANRLIFHSDPRSPAADRFRLIRMRLRDLRAGGEFKRLLITSPLAHDGKSTILINLATALSERGKRSVLVIEADLHHSTLVADLKLNTWPGLSDCMQDETLSPLAQIRRVDPLGWHLLPAGEPRRNPTELLQTPALRAVLQKVSNCFDWVLIDSPPVVPLTDSLALQQHTDGSLLVVRAGQTPREAVDQTVEILGSKNIVGVVLNGVERRNQPSYQQGYYSGGARNDD